MTPEFVIQQLEANCQTISLSLLKLEQSKALWKPNPNQWCMLEIICHLIDEEREDFRTRVLHLLHNPNSSPPAINPLLWVTERKYMDQNFKNKIEEFIFERTKSISILKTLEMPNWDNQYTHKTLGSLSAMHFLNNWLAHDYLHIRQITKLKYDFLVSVFPNTNFSYAGNWI